MKKRTRWVQAEVEVSTFEMTEDEAMEAVRTLQKISRMCDLVPQDFDRQGIKALVTSLLDDQFHDLV